MLFIFHSSYFPSPNPRVFCYFTCEIANMMRIINRMRERKRQSAILIILTGLKYFKRNYKFLVREYCNTWKLKYFLNNTCEFNIFLEVLYHVQNKIEIYRVYIVFLIFIFAKKVKWFEHYRQHNTANIKHIHNLLIIFNEIAKFCKPTMARHIFNFFWYYCLFLY